MVCLLWVCCWLCWPGRRERQVAKTGKQATVVFVLLIATGGALAMMGYVSIERIVSNVQKSVPFVFNSLCDA